MVRNMSLLQPIKSLKTVTSKFHKGIPLRLVLVMPLVVNIFLALVMVGYLSLQNCHQTVNELTNQLTDKVSNIVEQHLDTYLATPHQINRLNVDAIKLGLLDLDNYQKVGNYFGKQMQAFDVSHISYGLLTGEFIGASRGLEGQGITIDEVYSQNKSNTYTYATDSQGNRRKVTQVDDYKPRSEAWYADTIKIDKPNWSQVYTWEAPPGTTDISISANNPIYYYNNKIIGR